MSKIIYAYFRDKEKAQASKIKIKQICDSINPDNIEPNPSSTYSISHTTYGISNPVSTIRINEKNILLGSLLNNYENWENTDVDYPDGNYAIFRQNEDVLEIVSDRLGTRSVWYYKDEEKFIVATSQRAIIKFLGNFQFEEKVIPWMISTGNLSFYSWDKRISLLPPSGSILLDKKIWNYKIKVRKSIKEEQKEFPEIEYKKLLFDNLDATFSQYTPDFSKWALSLSGGHDCRGILAFLSRSKKSISNLQTVTWGDKNAENLKGSDANIARKVAKCYKTKHHFYKLDFSDKNARTILERFLKNGEGRIDHIGGYLDGFKIWKNLFESEIEGLIRGNVLFSNISASSEYQVRSFMGISLLSEIPNLSKFQFLAQLEQEVPERFSHRKNEKLSVYRDRLLAKYRIPIVQAALADLKHSYVEEFNPLLTNRLIDFTQMMPDHLRNNKVAFKEIVASLDPYSEYASKGNNNTKRNFLRSKQFLLSVEEELNSTHAREIFPQNFLNAVLSELHHSNQQNKPLWISLKSRIASLIPLKLKKKISGKIDTRKKLDIFTLVFRLTLISMMTRILKNEAGDHILILPILISSVIFA
ncbi:hypothetical protein RM553_17285 [Zunongwangia sp. F363]|uniref:asparagine synthase (glutamine-hydrolyzing) n=1 Tax=Autumnicola tepida TaxID=3075595 RepID=A0ABU3CE29_9FLAO|nr:hypothetical protein [Zunongwangia sp. F363]MDT0644598.1 hypothetical protein [Zunongwangia sp. F363]